MRTKTIFSSVSIHYYLNKTRPNKEGKCPIYVRVSVNGTQTAFSIKRSILLKSWSSEANLPIGSTMEISELKSYISSLNIAFSEINDELSRACPTVTAQMIRKRFERKSLEGEAAAPAEAAELPALRAKSQAGSLFFEAFKLFIAKEKELIGIDTSKTTVSRFELIARFFHEFLTHKGIEPEAYKLNDLDKKAVLEFKHYLKTVVGNNHNTAMKKLERLRKFTNFCLDYKLMSENPFVKVHIGYKKTKRVQLTEDELNLLISKDLSHCKRLELVRDTFVFACFTGLAYADMLTLQRSQVERLPDDSYCICKDRVKTEETACIPLMNIPLQILQKYCDLGNAKGNDLIFNMNSNEKMNAYLKEIAVICGIEKNLTTLCKT